MNKSIKAKLTEGKISALLFRLTIPMIAGMLSMTIFNLVDTLYVGQLGKKALAAMSFTFPVVMVLNSIALGIGMGASAVISRAIGKGDRNQVKMLSTNALLLALFIVAIFIIAGELTIYPLFRAMGASGEILTLIRSYMSIWYIGVIFVVIPMVGNNIIRATGDMKTTGVIMTSAAIFNMILDPLLIFGLGPLEGMGIRGGAIATVIARSMTMIFSLRILINREHLIILKPPKIKELWISWKKILFIGLPAALANIIIPISMGFITRLVSSYGVGAVAGFGVAGRLEMLAMLVIRSLAVVMVPFTGQNWGSGNKNRVRSGLKISYTFSIVFGLLVFIFFYFLTYYFAWLFNRDQDVIKTVVLYMRIIAVSYGFQGIFYIGTASLNALHKPFHSAGLALSRMFFIYIPLALAGSYFFELKGIFIGGLVANVIGGVITIIVTRKQTK